MRDVARAIWWSSALALALGVTSHAAAQASGPVIVIGVRGPQGSSVRRALVRDLERNGVTVVADSEVDAARDRLGVGRSLDDEQAVALAREVGAVAIVEGRVRRQRRRWSATLRVRNGFDGQVLGQEAWGGRTARALRGVGRTGHQRLAGYLAQGRAPGRAYTQNPTPTGEVPWWERRDATAAPMDDERPGDRDDRDDRGDDSPSTPVERSDRYAAFRVSLGGGTLYRGMSTRVRVYASQRGLNPAVPEVETIDEGRSYASDGIGHGELGARLEVYPGAFDDGQAFPYLGAVLAFSHSVGVQSTGVDRATGEDVPIGTEQLELLVAARFRYRFSDPRGEPELHLDVGWGMFQFNLALEQLQRVELATIIPPMQHGYVHVGAGLSYMVAPPYLTLGAEVVGRIGTNLGADTRNVWGTTTAPSNGFGLGVEAQVDIAEGFFVGAQLQYFMFSTDFSGQVGCAVQSECDNVFMNPWEDRRLWEVWPVVPPQGGNPPDLEAVEGGPLTPVMDNYVRLHLEVGWAFY